MPINSKKKGSRAELEFSHFLNDNFGFTCRRGQQFSGSPESPDVVGLDGIHIEVKHRDHLNLHEAMAQATNECGGNVPLVAHRKNRSQWLLTIRASDLEEFIKAMEHCFFNNRVIKLMGVPLVPEEHREALLSGAKEPR